MLAIQSQNQVKATGKHVASALNSLSKWMKSGLQKQIWVEKSQIGHLNSPYDDDSGSVNFKTKQLNNETLLRKHSVLPKRTKVINVKENICNSLHTNYLKLLFPSAQNLCYKIILHKHTHIGFLSF